MINIIPIIIDERGSVKKDITILAMENENISKRFSILLPNSIVDKWLYIEFEKADGIKSVSERLKAIGSYIEYDINNQLTIKGKLICQVVAKNEKGLVWKSNKFDFTIPSSINATEEVAASKPDILADLQGQIDNIEVGGGADLTNYYTKAEVDNKISEIPTNEIDLSNYYLKTETYSQIEVDNLISNISTGSGSSSTPIVEVSGSNVTLEPNKHYVISGVTNSLRISLSEPIETELKHYSFEFTTIDRVPTVTINGVDQPYIQKYEKHTKYLCEIVNNHLVILGTYDGYEYQFVYGTYATSDWTSSYNLKNDRTFVYVGTETKNGTYTVEYSEANTRYEIYLTFEDEDFKTAYWAGDGTITIEGVVYTKS